LERPQRRHPLAERLFDARRASFLKTMFGGLHSPRSPLPSEGALLEIAREFTPRVEARGPTPVVLDLHGLGRAWPAPEALGRAILDAARGRDLAAQLALAFSRTAALFLSQARPGLTIVPAGAEAEAMAPLPVTVLGLDPDREELFHRWGIRTLGEIARLPAAGLAERLGPEGPRLRRLARGEDETPLVPTPPPESFESTLDLEWPVDGLEPLSFLLGRVLEPLCDGLRARGRRAVGMALALKLVDGTLHRRGLRPAAPSAEARTWRTLLLLDLEAHPPHDAVQAITLRAEPTPSRPVQFSLLDPAQPSPERLAETMARLHEWTAAGRAGTPSLLDTHRPGAFVVGTFAPGPAASRAFRPMGPRAALRVFRPPLRAHVAVRDGAPVQVAAAGIRGAVLDRAGPWRASGDWWDAAWSREEWDVLLSTAGLYRIFRELVRGEWFVEGELD
jgi:protein ImuB